MPEVYLAVSLKPAPSGSSLGASGLGGLDRVRRRAEAILGVGGSPIPIVEMEALITEEERILTRVAGCVPARRARTDELQWLLKRAGCRRVSEPMLDPHWKPCPLEVEAAGGRAAFQPLGGEVVRHVSAPVFEQDRCLVVDAEEARSFQAILALGAMPEQTVFPGTAELLHRALEAVSFPADCVIHARRVSNRDALVRVRRRIVDADNAYAEQVASAHGPLSYVVEENRQPAHELDAYLQGTERPPLLSVAMSLAVGAPSREEPERRVEEIRQAFGTVSLHRPLGLQPALYGNHLPRPDGGVFATTPTCSRSSSSPR
jgi:hypothetical protein